MEDRFQFYFDFIVNQSLDLNNECSRLRKKLKKTTEKTFFLGLSSKALVMSAEIPFSGFVAGQTVTISISYLNDSSVDVEETEVSLVKIVHYNSKRPRHRIKEREESEAEARCDGVAGKSLFHNFKVSFPIPPVPPTSITCCQVIQISYEIHVVARVGGIHRNPMLRLPIAIGTVPFTQKSPTTGSVFFTN